MTDIRKRLARVLALMDGRALTGADHVRATKLILELQDAGLELVDRVVPPPERPAAWQRDIARMHLAELEIAEALPAAERPLEVAA